MVLGWGTAQQCVQSLSARLPAFPPSAHSGSHYSPQTWHKKKLQTQAATAGRTKATSPDLQSTGDSTVGKGVNRLFFADLFLPRRPGYESSSFCWIITVESIGMWFILNQIIFSRVYRYIRFQFCPIFSACLEKNYRVHLLLLKLLLISFLLEVIGHF